MLVQKVSNKLKARLMICDKKINYIFEANTLLSSDNLPYFGCIVATL